MAITDFLFPQGNFLNIRSNAPNQRSYNIDATADLARNLPGGGIKDVIAPAAAALFSLPYDAIQATTRTTEDDFARAMETAGMYGPKDIMAEAEGLAYARENPLSSAYERMVGASAPLAERISNISNPFKMSQAAASEVDLSNRNINTTEPYQDKIMGGLEGDLDPYNFNRRFEESYTEPVGVPGMDKKAINYTDAPVRLMMRKNNPATGFFDEMRSMGNPDASLVNRTKDKLGQGFNIGKQGLLSALGFATGIPLGILGMLPERDYRQNVVEDFYSDPNTRGLMSKIPGMENYNTVSGGLLNMLTGGKMGEETTFGLSGAIDKRMARINKTLAKQKKNKSKVLRQRLKDLQALKDRETKALADAAKQKAMVGAQSFNPKTTSGGRGDYRSDRDNSRDGGYGGSSKRSADNRSSDLGFSDIRLKENVELIGTSPSNINIYKFNYKDNPTKYQGAMAHEVPWASVKHSNGYMMVDYNKIDVKFKKWQR